MYFLQVCCRPEEVDRLSGELWEVETAGVRELENNDGSIALLAAFESNRLRATLLAQFASFSPVWTQEPDTDWVAETQRAWPGRSVGECLFLAAPWSEQQTPDGRLRIIHNPGLACGTGEHPCTQLALLALERNVSLGSSVADIGTGAGLLAIAALKLGAAIALGFDVDEAALHAARENFALNQMRPRLVAGSVDCICAASFDIVVVNINASVLLSMADELLGIPRSNGALILTGFPRAELEIIKQVFPPGEVLEREGWSCVISRISAPV